MWTMTINIFPDKGGDTSLRITILDANKDRLSRNADTRLVPHYVLFVSAQLNQLIHQIHLKKTIRFVVLG